MSSEFGQQRRREKTSNNKNESLGEITPLYDHASIQRGFRIWGLLHLNDVGQRIKASPYHHPVSCAPTSLRYWHERSPGTAAWWCQPTAEIQRVLRWRDQNLSWTKRIDFVILQNKKRQDIMSDSAETMSRQKGKAARLLVSVLQIRFLLTKWNETTTHTRPEQVHHARNP